MNSYWNTVFKRFEANFWGLFGACVLCLFFLVAIWAPFLASSQPICVVYHGDIYFPLFRYLLSTSFFTKKIDIFFNLLGLFFFPLLATFWLPKAKKISAQLGCGVLFLVIFAYFGFFHVLDPAVSKELNVQKQEAYLQLTDSYLPPSMPRARYPLPSWDFELQYLNTYAKLDLVLEQRNKLEQDSRLCALLLSDDLPPYSLFFIQQSHVREQIEHLQAELQHDRLRYQEQMKEEESLRRQTHPNLARLAVVEEANQRYEERENELRFLVDRQQWLDKEMRQISFLFMPLVRPHHWEDDVGGEQQLNLRVPFMELSRVNRQDLVAALIFGSRISLFVGFAATVLALGISIPLGLWSAFYGGKTDILICRFVEVWEAMPAFFMLMLIVTLLQTKSVFVVISVIALFGWTGIFRFVRAETFRQREMLYVDATRAIGFNDWQILFRQVLPNALVAVIALLPFDIMSAITREAALAFLGLGEEQSCSWGVLMDEGRSAFPAESMLLWPSAIILSILLIAIAFIGEALQLAMDPKSQD